jgi:hypothetical protein
MRHELLYETARDDRGDVLEDYPTRAVVFEIGDDGYKIVATILQCKNKQQARRILNKYYDYDLPRGRTLHSRNSPFRHASQ